jgi:xylulokinase
MAHREDLLLGMDVGTSNVKALLLDPEGRELDVASAPTPFGSGAGATEMTVDDLGSALAEVLAALGPARARVAGVGIAGMAECGAPLDAADRPAGPVIAWHDPRGEEVVARLRERFGAELDRRIGQPIRTVSSVAKLGWLIGRGCRGVRRWLGVPELCLWRLTGEEATEHSLAARTGCYDVVERRFLPEVASVAGLAVEVFPPVLTAGEVMGAVTGAGAAWSGLPEGAPVTLAGHDHLAAAEGVGAGRDDLVNSVGTAETVVRRLAQPPDMDEALALRVAITLRPAGREWVALTSAARAGLVLTAAARTLGAPIPVLDGLAEEAAGAIDATGMLSAILEGRRVTVPEGPAGMVWNGLLEALAGRTAEATDRLSRLGAPGGHPGGRPATRMLVLGGGARSRPWMRAKARRIPIPLHRPRTREAAARGAAVLAGVAAGWWPSPAAAPRPPLDPA